MAPILEGRVKYKEGKKWRTRFCKLIVSEKSSARIELYILEDPADFLVYSQNSSQIKKISPSEIHNSHSHHHNSSGVQNSYEKSHSFSNSSSFGIESSSLISTAATSTSPPPTSIAPNDHIYGYESGRHVDKEHCVLVLIGLNTVHCMAMNGLDEMFRWADILDKIVKEYRFHVSLVKSTDGSRLHRDPGTLHIQSNRLCLIAEPAQGNKFICAWPFNEIETDGKVVHQSKECYMLHTHKTSGKGRGKHIIYIEDKSVEEFLNCLNEMKTHYSNHTEFDYKTSTTATTTTATSFCSSNEKMSSTNLPSSGPIGLSSASAIVLPYNSSNNTRSISAASSAPVNSATFNKTMLQQQQQRRFNHHLSFGLSGGGVGGGGTSSTTGTGVATAAGMLYNKRSSPLSPPPGQQRQRVRGSSECERSTGGGGTFHGSTSHRSLHGLSQRRSSDITIPASSSSIIGKNVSHSIRSSGGGVGEVPVEVSSHTSSGGGTGGIIVGTNISDMRGNGGGGGVSSSFQSSSYTNKFSPLSSQDSTYFNMPRSYCNRYSIASNTLPNTHHSRANSTSQNPSDLMFTPDEDYCDVSVGHEYFTTGGPISPHVFGSTPSHSNHNMGRSLDSSSFIDRQSISSLTSPGDYRQVNSRGSMMMMMQPTAAATTMLPTMKSTASTAAVALFQIGKRDLSLDKMVESTVDCQDDATTTTTTAGQLRSCRSLDYLHLARDFYNNNNNFPMTQFNNHSLSIRFKANCDKFQSRRQYLDSRRFYLQKSLSSNALYHLNSTTDNYCPIPQPSQPSSRGGNAPGCGSLLSPISEGEHFLQTASKTVANNKSNSKSLKPDLYAKKSNILDPGYPSPSVSYGDGNIVRHSYRRGNAAAVHNYSNVIPDQQMMDETYSSSSQCNNYMNATTGVSPDYLLTFMPDEMRYPQINYGRVDGSSESSAISRSLMARRSSDYIDYYSSSSSYEPQLNYANIILQSDDTNPTQMRLRSSSHANYPQIYRSAMVDPNTNYARLPYSSAGGGGDSTTIPSASFYSTSNNNGNSQTIQHQHSRHSDYTPIDLVKTRTLAEILMTTTSDATEVVSPSASSCISTISPPNSHHHQQQQHTPASSISHHKDVVLPRSRSILSTTSERGRSFFSRLQRKKSEVIPS